MTSLTEQVSMRSEQFRALCENGQICSKGMISSFNNSGVSTDFGGNREPAA
eukprot:UN07842